MARPIRARPAHFPFCLYETLNCILLHSACFFYGRKRQETPLNDRDDLSCPLCACTPRTPRGASPTSTQCTTARVHWAGQGAMLKICGSDSGEVPRGTRRAYLPE